jgi:hypothetical protein
MKANRMSPKASIIDNLFGIQTEQLLAVKFHTIKQFLTTVNDRAGLFYADDIRYGQSADLKFCRFTDRIPYIPVSGIAALKRDADIKGIAKLMEE